MKIPVPLLIVVVAVLAGGMAVTGRGPEAAARPLPQDTLEKRVQRLEREISAKTSTNVELTAKIAALEERARRVDAWFATLPGTVSLLERGVADAKAKGFTWAGPNPKAKEILLATLRRLASDLDAANPVAPAKPK